MMFEKWFGTRAHCPSERSLSFRPQLECLESRLAPSSMVPADDHGQGNGPPPGHVAPPGPGNNGPPPGHVAPPGPGNNGTIDTNANHSFNGSTITDSFNNTINNTIILMPAQQASVQGLLGISSLLAAELNSPQLGSLLNDEIALAVDMYLDAFPPVAAAIPSLSTDIGTLKAAIAANPLQSTPIGQVIGTVAFDVTLTALTTAQPTV